MSALVLPADMDVLGPPPTLSSSPLIGADYLSELQCAPWRPPASCAAASAASSAAAAAAVDALSGQMARLSKAAPRPILASQHGKRLHGKKRVAFADDKGLALVQTRLLVDTANLSWALDLQPSLPPLMPPVPQRPHWNLSGGQPVSDFSRFSDRLQHDSVALETAVCGAGQRTIKGVIRVKNLGFEKRVFLRATTDAWRTSCDWSATYIARIDGAVGPPPPYDRFAFEVETPEVGSDAERIEFCVCFRCDAGEFWDNNNGENYVSLREKVSEQAPERPGEGTFVEVPRPPPREVFRAKAQTNWAYFSSWEESVANEVPYW